MDPLTIAALIAMIASAGMQYSNQRSASKRANEETMRALENQRQLQMQAEKTALDNADNFNEEARQDRMENTQQVLEQEFSRPAISAQQINQRAATTRGNVSDDYAQTKASTDANTMRLAQDYARLFSTIRSGQNLRRDEGFGMADAASNIGRLQSFSRGQQQVDDLKIRNAAQPNAAVGLVSNILGAAGSAGMMYAGANAANGAVVNHPFASLADKPLNQSWTLSGTPVNPLNFG